MKGILLVLAAWVPLAIVVNILFALAGEPRAIWFMHDVLGWM